MAYYTHAFEAVVDRFAVGKTKPLWYNVVFLPAELEAELPFEAFPRLRIDGELNEQPIAGAFMPTGDGRYYLILSSKFLKQAGARVGEVVEVRFRIDEQDRVDVPAELERALARDNACRAAWDALTPGRRRGITHYVRTAKTAPTLNKRIVEALEVIAEFNGDFRKWQQARRKRRQSAR